LPEKRSFENWEHVENVHYGYGWRILTLKNGSKWIFHGGYVNRYQSLVAFSPKLKIGLSVLFNSDCPLARDVMKKFIEMFEDLPHKSINCLSPKENYKLIDLCNKVK
jgi:CubicO group peptidase (beta-lactamase class C family)